MGYRKFSATVLFTGKEFLQNKVLITSDDGLIKEIVDAETAGDDVVHYDGLICPGFVNTHCHFELSHMKGVIPKGTGLVTFLSRVISERFISKERIMESMLRAYEEMYTSGTVAVADICNGIDSLPIKISGSIQWRNFIEVIGFTDHPEDRFEYALKILSQFNAQNGNISANSLVPHAPYSVSPKLFSMLDSASGDVSTIHNQETAAENDLYIKGSGQLYTLYNDLKIDPSFFRPSGKSSVQTYLPWMKSSNNIILVHNTYTSPEDIRYIRQLETQSDQRIYFAVCLRANHYIESANPPVDLLVKNNCRITLGTDSYASNDSLNLFDEIKSLFFSFPHIPLDEILKWGTLNGAESLNMDEQLGSFAHGKKPGVVFISNLAANKLTKESRSSRLL